MKLVFKILGGFIALIIITIGVIVVTVDPNDYRDEITELVKKETGRDLHMQSLSLSLFPRFGLNLENTTLSNAKGFSEQNFLHIDNVQLGVAILPLLSKQLEVDTLTIHGLTLNLEKNAKGITNWDDLVKPSDQTESTQKTPKSEQGNPLEKLASLKFGGLDIQNGKIHWVDDSTGQDINLTLQAFSTSAITFGEFFNIALSAETTLSEPAIKAQVELTIEAKLEQNGEYAVRNLALKTTASGKGIPVEKITKTLNIPTLNLTNNQLNLPTLTVDYDVIGGEDFPLKTVKGQLQVNALKGDLTSLNFQANNVTLQTDVMGEALPNGAIQATLSMQPQANINAQTASIKQLALTVMGVKATGEINATQITSNPIVNAQLDIAQTNLRQLLESLNVTLPDMADKKTLTQFSAALKMAFNAKTQAINIPSLKITLDDTQLSGSASVSQFDAPNIRYNLALTQMDLNRYLPTPKAPVTPDKKEENTSSEAVEIKLPVELLRKLTLNGTFKANQITYDKLHPKNLVITLKGQNGQITANPIKTDIFNTTIRAQAGVDVSGKTQKFSFKLDGKNIPIGDVLMAVADTDKLSGTGSVNINITTAGKSISQFKQNLNGTTSMDLVDGAVKGFNLAQSIREAQAKMSGKPVPPNKGESKTDFSSLIAQLNIKQGIVTTPKLLAQAPFMRITGSGKINLPKESLNYLVRTKIVSTDKGQGGKELQNLNGLTIPVKLKGSYLSPKISLDISGLLAEKTKAEIELKIKSKKEELKKEIETKKAELEKEVTQKIEEQLKESLLKGFKF